MELINEINTKHRYEIRIRVKKLLRGSFRFMDSLLFFAVRSKGSFFIIAKGLGRLQQKAAEKPAIVDIIDGVSKSFI